MPSGTMDLVPDRLNPSLLAVALVAGSVGSKVARGSSNAVVAALNFSEQKSGRYFSRCASEP